MQGEWIEILADIAAVMGRDRSLPMQGEWIEMTKFDRIGGLNMGLSPCRESGLKFPLANSP